MVPTAGQSVSHPAAGAVVLRGPPQQASGQTAAPQIAARATYANAYKPPDAPLRRPLPPNTDPYEPVGVRVGSFLLGWVERVVPPGGLLKRCALLGSISAGSNGLGA
jgi:hypothetical protein